MRYLLQVSMSFNIAAMTLLAKPKMNLFRAIGNRKLVSAPGGIPGYYSDNQRSKRFRSVFRTFDAFYTFWPAVQK